MDIGRRGVYGQSLPVFPRRSLGELYYAVETLVLAPGILAHEGAHLLACRLAGVEVRSHALLDPFAPVAGLEHDRINSFPADFAVAVAPLPVNSLLALVAFALATSLDGLVALPAYWLGAVFALTAFPSVGDTRTLFETADALTWPARPLGSLLAAPVRYFTLIPGSAGVCGLFWALALLDAGRGLGA
jgi:hypothetical protein